MSWVPFGKESRALCNLRQARVQLLVSGLNAREINRHGAKGAQASTAELSDSRNSRKRPRQARGRVRDDGLWQFFLLSAFRT